MPVLNTICLKMQNKIIYYCQSDNQLGLHSNSTKLYNVINCVLLMNKI